MVQDMEKVTRCFDDDGSVSTQSWTLGIVVHYFFSKVLATFENGGTFTSVSSRVPLRKVNTLSRRTFE